MPDYDLFGQEIIKDVLLRDKFIEPPFSVLDTKGGEWQARKRAWISRGIKSEVGRSAKAYNCHEWIENNRDKMNLSVSIHGDGTSIFDPALSELMYRWFCPDGGAILDPFAGGSVRGIVANYLGYKYTGFELRPEQVESNIEQGLDILPVNNQPQWYCGDSEKLLDSEWFEKFDFLFSCPPYVDMEVYSDLPDDLSTMAYDKFLIKYKSIIKKSLSILKKDCFACFVVSEVRNKKGFYYDFVGDTKRAFIECGANFYNDAVLLNSIGSACLRTKQFNNGKKLVKVHQNVLIFKK